MARAACGRYRDQARSGTTRGVILSREEELDDLIAAFGRRLHQQHPNIERIGCPGRHPLHKLAMEPESLAPGSILDHVRQCAACLDELREIRMSTTRSEDRE